VSRSGPGRIRAYAELIRYPLVAVPIVATLPGIVLAAHETGWNWRAAVALLTSQLGYFAGMIKNDYFHRETDARSNPLRPLPSGRIAPKHALRLASTLYAVCVGLGFLLGWRAGALVLVLIAISHSYNAYLKQRGLWGSLVLPLGIALLVVFGAVGVSGEVPPLAWFAFGTVFLYDFGTHVASTFKDIDRDRQVGLTTTALQLGTRASLVVSTGSTLAAFVVALLPIALGVPPIYAIWVAIALVTTAITRLPLLRNPSERTGYRALEGAMAAGIVLFPALGATAMPLWMNAVLIGSLLLLTRVLFRTSRQEV